MAENVQSAKSKKDSFNERLLANRPELNLEDEDAYYGAINEDYDNYENNAKSLKEENERYKDNERQLVEFATANKNNGLYLDDLMSGKDIFASAIERHGYDGVLEYLQSDEAREKYQQEEENYRARLEKSKKLDEEASLNREETDKNLMSAIEAGEFTREDCEKAIDFLMDINDGLNVNHCEVEWIKMALNAMNHDADVDNAREEGRIEGVNEGVEKQMRKKSKDSAPSNLPSMPVGAGGKKSIGGAKRGGSLSEMLLG